MHLPHLKQLMEYLQCTWEGRNPQTMKDVLICLLGNIMPAVSDAEWERSVGTRDSPESKPTSVLAELGNAELAEGFLENGEAKAVKHMAK